ncbi:DUF1430 domain-containing protein [Lactococcus garvieae]|nr:DUF1430 domain-containing protein [Lactococcus garvieae]
MNKVLKISLLLLFSILSLMLAYIRNNDKEAKKLIEAVSLPEYTQIYQPEKHIENFSEGSEHEFLERKDFIQVMEEVSKEFNTPFIVRSRFIDAEDNGKGRVNFAQPLSKITFFKTDFQSSDEKFFEDHGEQVSIENAPINKLTDEQYQGAAILFKSKVKEDVLQSLSQKLNQRFSLRTTPTSLVTQPKWYVEMPPILGNNQRLEFFIKVIFVFYFILLLVWTILRSKEVAIYSLNGLSAWEIIKRIYLRAFLVTQTFVTLAASIFILRRFDIYYLSRFAFLSILSLLLMSGIIGLVIRNSLVNQTNDKSFLKKANIVVYIAKTAAFVGSVYACMGLIFLLNSSLGLFQKSPIDDYGIFYKGGLGYSESYGQAVRSKNLFTYLENNGGLHAVKKYLPQKNLEKYQAVEINSAYLQKYTIRDTEGKPVNIDKHSSEGIVLVNEHLKNKISEIKKGYKELQELPDVWFQGKEIRYLLIKGNQKIPVFEMDETGFYEARQEEIQPDLVEVHTVKNAGYNTYINMFQGANPLGVLVPIKENAEKTYLELLPALKKDKIASIFTSFVPVRKIAETDVKHTIGEPWSWVFRNLLVFILFLLMIFSTTIIYFKSNRKKLALYRVQGFSFIRTYSSLLAMIFIQNLAFALHSRSIGYDTEVIQAYVLFTIIELALVFYLLTRLEKKELVTTLKGA